MGMPRQGPDVTGAGPLPPRGLQISYPRQRVDYHTHPPTGKAAPGGMQDQYSRLLIDLPGEICAAVPHRDGGLRQNAGDGSSRRRERGLSLYCFSYV